jgi:hypothetical protein
MFLKFKLNIRRRSRRRRRNSIKQTYNTITRNRNDIRNTCPTNIFFLNK